MLFLSSDALELFESIDFEYQLLDNKQYSQLWKDAIAASNAAQSAKVPLKGHVAESRVDGVLVVVTRKC